jgi:hypothetical protein
MYPLDALSPAIDGKQPVMIEVDDPVNNELSFFRAVKIAEEFDLQLWILGSGHEYRQLEFIKASKASLILPINFPKPPYVHEPEEALSVNLTDLLHW